MKKEGYRNNSFYGMGKVKAAGFKVEVRETVEAVLFIAKKEY